MNKCSITKKANRSITELLAQAIAHQTTTSPIAKNIAKQKAIEASERLAQLNKVTKDFKNGIKITN